MLKFIDSLKYPIFRRKLAWSGRKQSKKQVIEKMDQPIDFVVTWVDGNDPEWIAQKNKYMGIMETENLHSANGEERYRDWDFLRYWFRAVEKYAPWVNNVYFITYGHLPEWLNLDAPKLKIVKHSDYIPAEYLPTFSSIPIELNMHRIEGLSEHFVYFNDDMFLNRPVEPEDFFRAGKPNYTSIVEPLKNHRNNAFEHMQFTNLCIINGLFDGQVSRKIQEYPEKWFSDQYNEYQIRLNLDAYDKNYIFGMHCPHLGVPYRKTALRSIWEKCYPIMNESSSHKFRTPMDAMHQIFSLYEIMNGEFNPVSIEHHGRFFANLVRFKEEIVDAIINRKYRMICINDSEHISRSEHLVLKKELLEAFGQVFSEKSVYEK